MKMMNMTTRYCQWPPERMPKLMRRSWMYDHTTPECGEEGSRRTGANVQQKGRTKRQRAIWRYAAGWSQTARSTGSGERSIDDVPDGALGAGATAVRDESGQGRVGDPGVNGAGTRSAEVPAEAVEGCQRRVKGSGAAVLISEEQGVAGDAAGAVVAAARASGKDAEVPAIDVLLEFLSGNSGVPAGARVTLGVSVAEGSVQARVKATESRVDEGQ
jgi:hypothetical protein